MSSDNTKPLAEPPLLFIDANEESKHHWSREARTFGFNPSVMGMDIGDFRFVAGGFMWYIERKAAPSDLEASFKDGRLATQTFRAHEQGIDKLVFLIEGEINQVILGPNIKGTLLEMQALGVFLDFCRTGEVVQRLFEMYHHLNKDDHGYLRKPVTQLPTKYVYLDRDRRRRVLNLMSFEGVGETTAVEALKRWTLDEVYSKPELLLELRNEKGRPIVDRKTVIGMYEVLEREAPSSLLSAPQRRSRRARSITDLESEDPDPPMLNIIDLSTMVGTGS